MTKREEYPAGVPCFVDSGRVDSAAAREFYGGLLGWEFEDVSPGGDAPPYHMAKLQGLTVAGVGTQPGQDWEPAWNTYVSVQDADATAAAVTDAGGKVAMAPFDIGTAGRMAVFTDPQGAEFCVWEAGRTQGAELVNAPGAVVFNTLHTPDLAAAVDFYAAVFGWEMTAEGEQSWMIRLPGYVEVQDRLAPGFADGLEQMGAPEGFGDVVAAVATGEPARWEVTFAVESADAAARTRRELGGQVVSPPQDLPWVRETTLRDPEGTQFVASRSSCRPERVASSARRFSMTTGSVGMSPGPVWTPSMASTASMPEDTSPNTVCLPSSQPASPMVTMKNWLPLVLGPALAIASAPRTILWSLNSSSNL